MTETFLQDRTRSFAAAASAVAILGLLSAGVSATDLRGRIESVNRYSSVPAYVGGVLVELLDASGASVLARYSTGNDGLYYFTGIAPGNYLLRVEGQVYPLTIQAQTAQDIGPIRLQR